MSINGFCNNSFSGKYETNKKESTLELESPFESLPNEMIMEIFGRVGFSGLDEIAIVSHRWQVVSVETWQHYGKELFNLNTTEKEKAPKKVKKHLQERLSALTSIGGYLAEIIDQPIRGPRGRNSFVYKYFENSIPEWETFRASKYIDNEREFLSWCDLPIVSKYLVKIEDFTPKFIGDFVVDKLMSLIITKFTNLQTLKLNCCRATEVPNSIGELTNLTTLEFSYNPITSLPESIGELVSLQEIQMCACSLTELPSSINKLTSLKELAFNAEKLNPGSLEYVKDLKKQGVVVRFC